MIMKNKLGGHKKGTNFGKLFIPSL